MDRLRSPEDVGTSQDRPVPPQAKAGRKPPQSAPASLRFVLCSRGSQVFDLQTDVPLILKPGVASWLNSPIVRGTTSEMTKGVASFRPPRG